MQNHCEECRRLIKELTCATTETVAIRADMVANNLANQPVSRAKIQLASDANAARKAALEAIRAHRRETHW